ncbi:cupin domain-containing protein [Kribbella swartbergensis]
MGRQRSLWEDKLRQTQDERTYAEVFASEHLGVWAISWMAEDHGTGYHDHDRSRGAVFVAKGTIRHEHLKLGRQPVGRAVPSGETFSFDETFIHGTRREPNAGDTVTIHAYSPPLKETGQYAESETDGLLHRRPSPVEEQLVPHGDQGTPSTASGPEAQLSPDGEALTSR